jgi:hypothetical protein
MVPGYLRSTITVATASAVLALLINSDISVAAPKCKSGYIWTKDYGCIENLVPATPKKCRIGSSPVEKWGCVKNIEIKRAKAICAKPKLNFAKCLCQDGNSVGACGD